MKKKNTPTKKRGIHMEEFHYALLGARLKNERTKQNITQEKLAELVGCSSAHISHIETGSTIPSLRIILKIINQLHISSDALLCDYVDNADYYRSEWNNFLQNCTDKEAKWIINITMILLQNIQKYKD